MWQHCSVCLQLFRVRVRVQSDTPAELPPSCPLAEDGSRAAAQPQRRQRQAATAKGSTRFLEDQTRGGVGPCSGYPVCGGPPLPNCLVSLCVAMIAITLLATQGHGFRCVSSFRQVSLAFGQPRVASPSRAQLPPASACVRSLRAPRLAVWVPAPASLSA